jgi:hypothetical protein
MRTLGIVIIHRSGDRSAGMIEAMEKGLVEQFVPHAAIETMGFRGSMTHQSTSASCVQANIAFDVNSVP